MDTKTTLIVCGISLVAGVASCAVYGAVQGYTSAKVSAKEFKKEFKEHFSNEEEEA